MKSDQTGEKLHKNSRNTDWATYDLKKPGSQDLKIGRTVAVINECCFAVSPSCGNTAVCEIVKCNNYSFML